MKSALNPYGLAAQFADPDIIVATAQMAEAAGFAQFVLTDHVVMGPATDTYPYGPWPTPLEFPWWEPLTTLAVVAGATRRIRLATGVLIAPLRSAVLLAKQAATLDQLSGGRLDLGLGVGWQEAEYVASGVPFASRRRYFIEQLRVMKRLWRESPVDFAGEFVRLDGIYCSPRPLQQPGIPLSIGMAPTARNLDWMMELADGYLPIADDPAKYGPELALLRESLVGAGRPLASFEIRVRLKTLMDPTGQPDLAATLRQVPALSALGVTAVEFYPIIFLRQNSRDALEDLIGRCAEILRDPH